LELKDKSKDLEKHECREFLKGHMVCGRARIAQCHYVRRRRFAPLRSQ
jgi:hypothetical protein